MQNLTARLVLAAIITVLSLAGAAGAQAITIQTTDTTEPWQAWADHSQAPTWNGTLPLTTTPGYFDCGGWGQAAGCTSLTPVADQTTGQIIPNQYDSISTEIALGDPVDYEQGYFLHELGQIFWAVYMTPADEDQFMRVIGLAGDHTDWSHAYTVVRYGVTIHFPPFEWFAEGYRLCALFGVNQPASASTFSDFGYPGLQASFAARQRQVCQLIDRVGLDNGVGTPAQTPARVAKANARRVVLPPPVRWHGRIIHTTRGRRKVW